MTVLVTGATGLIGRAFLRTTCAKPETVALTRDLSHTDSSNTDDRIQWLAVDLRSPAFTRSLPRRIDAIVHLAQSDQYRAFPEGAEDVVAVNLTATAHLLDYARSIGAQRFVFASTATIYEPSHHPLGEGSPIRCSSFYAASKRAAELLVEQYSELMTCWLLRIFTVYGPQQRDQLIPNLIRRVETGEPVTVQGRSGLPISPIHSADVARVIWQAATSGEAGADAGGVVNVGGTEALAIRQMAEQIGEAIGRTPRFKESEGPDPPGWIADLAKLERTFGPAKPRSFADGIRETLAAGGAGGSVGSRSIRS